MEKMKVSSQLNDLENIPSNRFRDWFKLVPEWIRREYVYNIWKQHQEMKLGKDSEKLEYKKWEESILKGKEGRNELEKRVAISKKYFENWLKKVTEGTINKDDVAYAVLWGSSFYAPRNSTETDLDIGVILKPEIKISDKFLSDWHVFGLSKVEINVSEKEYTGKIDFFIHKPISGRIAFILFPHVAIFIDPSFTRSSLKDLVEGHIEIIQEDINSILGKGKLSQEELKAMIEKSIEEFQKAIESIGN